MRLGKCQVQNFASYEHLDFNFNDLGLTLIHGATGSGKSTLQDIPSWILFGVTAKQGSVDEVKSWSSNGSPTVGHLDVTLPDGIIKVTRVRGGAKENDLYWIEEATPDKKERGKDLLDTQKQLNRRLGMDASIYCTAAYLNEFSDAGFFFLAKAKDRREIFERIADLSFPMVLLEKTLEERKVIKKSLNEFEQDKNVDSGKLNQLLEMLEDLQKSSHVWEQNNLKELEELTIRSKNFDLEKTSKIEALKLKSYRFEEDKTKKIENLINKIDELDEKIIPSETLDAQIMQAELEESKHTKRCSKCNQPIHLELASLKLKEYKAKNDQMLERRSHYVERLHEVQSTKNPFTSQIDQALVIENHYDSQAVLLKQKINPFLSKIDKTTNTAQTLLNKVQNTTTTIETLKSRLSSVEQLQKLSLELRSVMLQKAVETVETETNRILNVHFDGEFSVNFNLQDQDTLDVVIKKSGNTCVYTQLSKGQRQLLRLAFSTSLMKAAANQAGVSVNLLCFDEALDGLDSNLKVKAFDLFQELSQTHESVLVIDHAEELKLLFDKKLLVELVGDTSQIKGINEFTGDGERT